MIAAPALKAALGDHGFVHVQVRSRPGIVKLMRTVNGLAVKQPSGEFTEFAADAWAAVAKFINDLFGLRAVKAPVRRKTEDEKWDEIVARAKAATAKLREFEDTLCWRAQYADGSDRPTFGSVHWVNRRGFRGSQTLCGKPVPQHLATYEDSGVDFCRSCARAHRKLEAEAKAGGYL